MATIETYKTWWEDDSQIDASRAGEASIRIPILHSKYMNALSTERIKFKKMIEAKKILDTKLHGYYSGIIDGRDIGRPAFELVIRTDAGVRKRVESDDEMIKRNISIIEQEEIVEFLVGIIKMINTLNFTIKNYIDYLKFSNGVG